MIRECTNKDLEEIFHIINDAARAYKGVIPEDCCHEPYMTKEELSAEIGDGVKFSCCVEDDEIVGGMGVQDRGSVALIGHAYVRTRRRNKGVGSFLLRELIASSTKPILIGTWKAATWAISFYEKHGFHLVDEEEKTRLLKRYWSIPDRQIETSVVLVDAKYPPAPVSSDLALMPYLR